MADRAFEHIKLYATKLKKKKKKEARKKGRSYFLNSIFKNHFAFRNVKSLPVLTFCLAFTRCVSFRSACVTHRYVRRGNDRAFSFHLRIFAWHVLEPEFKDSSDPTSASSIVACSLRAARACRTYEGAATKTAMLATTMSAMRNNTKANRGLPVGAIFEGSVHWACSERAHAYSTTKGRRHNCRERARAIK